MFGSHLLKHSTDEKKRMEILFWRHQTPAQKRKGKATLYLRATINGERADLGTTGIKINYENWDPDNQIIEEAEKLASYHNEELDNIRAELRGIYNELSRPSSSVKLSAETLKERYDGVQAEKLGPKPIKLVGKVKLLDAFLKFIDEYCNDPDHSTNTIRPLTSCRKKLTEFLESIHQTNITCENFDGLLLKKMVIWYKQQGLKASYAGKHARMVKQVVRWAKSEKLTKVNQLADERVKCEKPDDPIYMKHEHFKVWLGYRFRSRQAQEAADFFSVTALTALNYGDLINVIRNPKAYIRKGIDGKLWLYKERQKTDVMARIPIEAFPELMEIVNRYGGWENLPKRANAEINRWLKVCVAEINLKFEEFDQIYEDLSVRHGRKTFCNWWINVKGRSIESLLPIMGRTSDDDLRRYVMPDENAILKALDKN